MSHSRITVLIFALLLAFFSASVYADMRILKFEMEEAIKNNNEYIEHSYIISFRNPSVFNKGKNFEYPLIEPPDESELGKISAPFGAHSTHQSKENLAGQMGLEGEVISIFETINAIHVKMDAKEAEKWKNDYRVEYVEQDMIATTAETTQNNPGWGLDRIDERSATLDSTYRYTNTGAGQTIYILDTGLTLGNTAVAAEFGDRATIFWDVNGGAGRDCNGHGTRVASVAAGNTKGVAKGANLIIAKIAIDTTNQPCTGNSAVSTSVLAFNWLAMNAPAGTIVNWSHGFSNQNQICSSGLISTNLENSIRAAHNAGIIVVVAAGNDGCDTANYSPTRIPEAFVVGATGSNRIPFGQDARASFSRTGANISTFAPGQTVAAINQNGSNVTTSGTSFSAPYISGVFAVACEAVETFCRDATNAAELYTALRDTGTLNTVTNTNGAPLPSNTTSRFISQQW